MSSILNDVTTFFGLAGNGVRDIAEGHPIRGAAQLTALAIMSIEEMSRIQRYKFAEHIPAELFVLNSVALGAGYVSQGLSDLTNGKHVDGAFKLIASGSAIAFLQSYVNVPYSPLITAFAAGALSFAGRQLWNMAPQIKACISSSCNRLVSAIEANRAHRAMLRTDRV